jgi:ABC-type multidrug transport system permease subunit
MAAEASHNQPGVNDNDSGGYLKGCELMTFLWILLAIVYVACWVYFGLATFRKGHYWMFWIGFFLPFLWIIGALIAPTDHAAARAAGTA